MRYAVLAAAVIAGPLAGCQSPQDAAYSVQGGLVELGPQQIEQVMRGVTPSLKSPGAAQFGTIKAGKLAIGQGADARQGYAVCGEVSSRASFGDETMVPFVGGFKSDLREFRLLVLGGPAGKSAAVLRACQQAGIPL